MGSPAYTVRIDNLRDVQAALRAADKALPREIKKLMDTIANRLILPRVLARMRFLMVLPEGDARDHRHRSGKLERSVRAVSQQRLGVVKEGIAATPYGGWWEFGGSTKSSMGNTNRPFIAEGRTLYPAAREMRPMVDLEARRMMDRLAHIVEATR